MPVMRLCSTAGGSRRRREAEDGRQRRRPVRPTVPRPLAAASPPRSGLPPSAGMRCCVPSCLALVAAGRRQEQAQRATAVFDVVSLGRVMRTVMVVEFKVVEVTHISIRTRRRPEEVTVENRLQQAIQSLDSLNDQIVQFIFAPTSSATNGGPEGPVSGVGDDRAGAPDRQPVAPSEGPQPGPQHQQQREALHTSMALMRRLLVDAQAKFRRMMEENKALASRIDGDIQNAHQEVSLLRAELADTNKRITQISNSVVVQGNERSSSPPEEDLPPASTSGLRFSGSSRSPRGTSPSRGSRSPSGGRSPAGSRSPAGARSPSGARSPAGSRSPVGARSPIAAPSPPDDALAPGMPSSSSTFPGRSSTLLCSPPSADRPSTVPRTAARDGSHSGRSSKSGPSGSRKSSSSRKVIHAAARDSSPVSSADSNTEARQEEEEEDLDFSTADSLSHQPSTQRRMGASPTSCDRCRTCSHDPLGMSSLGSSVDELVLLGGPGPALESKLSALEHQNRHLSQLIGSLQRDLEQAQRLHGEGRLTPGGGIEEGPSPTHIGKLETELKHAKDALAALKQDRKRLKAEKFDLLNQMKQLYGTLEDKEKELRDFIRNYEMRMKESDDNLKMLVHEREESEREKWNILKHARDEAERCVALCAQLGLKEAQIKQLQDELCLVREKLGYLSDMDSGRNLRSNGYRSPSAASTNNGLESSNTPTPTLGSDPTSSYAGTPTITVDSDASPNHHVPKEIQRPSIPGLSRSAEEIYNSSGSSDTGSKKLRRRRDGKGGTWGSISRVFSRGKSRKTLEPGFYDGGDQQAQRSSWSPQSSLCASPLTEDSYPEKMRLLEEAQGLPMEKWKAATVMAWLEITLGMPQYGPACAENIKSGKILLELSDHELETGLGMTNVMHRRKLRLAIEEHREPNLWLTPNRPVKSGKGNDKDDKSREFTDYKNMYPKICLLHHQWVVEEWLPSLGLNCYADNFTTQLVDGRVLETLTKKDLEKYLNISRKFHQVSIMHAIQLMRMVKFDKTVLAQRRSHSENMDVDPLVWTNQRFIKWAKSIDLMEYAENLRDSGVHGALVVLEPSFQADTMATALGIPSSKNIIRRHLTTELDNLVQPARMSLEAEAMVNSKRGDKRTVSLHGVASTGSLGRTFLRTSSSKGALETRPDKRRSSMRGSLTRVLGLKLHDDASSGTTSPVSTSTADLRSKASVKHHHSHKQTVTVTTVSSPQVPKTGESVRRPAKQMETLTVTPV